MTTAKKQLNPFKFSDPDNGPGEERWAMLVMATDEYAAQLLAIGEVAKAIAGNDDVDGIPAEIGAQIIKSIIDGEASDNDDAFFNANGFAVLLMAKLVPADDEDED